MDINKVSSEIEFINQVGYTLNAEERLKLKFSIPLISKLGDFDEIKLWGKIESNTKDYYIAIAYVFKDQFEFPQKHFFWALQSDYVFQPLPELNMTYRNEVNQQRMPLTGNPQFAIIPLKESEGDQEQQPEAPVDEDDEDEDNIKIPMKPFLEIDRLAFVVRAIENDCALAPIGAYKMTPSHEIRYCDTFRGISPQQLTNVENYQHFRAPQEIQKKEEIARDDVIFKFDFLEGLKNDFPKGIWSLQTDCSKTSVTIRSLLWPGFIGYHQSNSRVFGSLYIGNGLKNCDLPFLLH